jgi:hypothetical protein
MPVRVNVADRSYMLDDLTLDEVVELEEFLDCAWLEVRPLRYARHGRAVLTIFMRRSMGEAEVAAALKAMTFADYEKALVFEPTDDLPVTWEEGLPLTDAAATTGSAGAPPTSGGRQTSHAASPSAT